MLYISAGHHRLAPGAAWKGFVEHDEALVWVKLLLGVLPNALAVPAGTLPQKVRWINREASTTDLAIEVHFNAAVPSAHGSETLYCPGSRRGEELAEKVQDCLAAFFHPDRGHKEGWYRMDRPGWVDFPGDKPGDEVPDYFLHETRCTALIIEPDFIYRAELIRSMRAACCFALGHVLEGL